MQVDMHFYGTYAIARAAGLPARDAHTVAYASQFVDDSKQQSSFTNPDGGLLYGIATAHTLSDTVDNAEHNPDEQWRVWVPFHFLLGGAGNTLSEKLLCVCDSEIAREMISHHCEKTIRERLPFGFELLGIAAHVYLDTFSHYGFSGVGSEYNNVDDDSFEFIGLENSELKAYMLDKRFRFIERFGLRNTAVALVEKYGGNVGHGAVATYPDRPFLHWQVTFEKPRPGNSSVSDRNNPKTYLEGCKKLHGYLSNFAKKYYSNSAPTPFKDIEDRVSRILEFEAKQPGRVKAWRDAIESGDLFPTESDDHDLTYSEKDWETEKENFHELATSTAGIETHAYRFHQAAALHRFYVLKELLPSHGIAVY